MDTVRTAHDAVDAADPSTAELLHTISDALEKQAWMLKSEDRKSLGLSVLEERRTTPDQGLHRS